MLLCVFGAGNRKPECRLDKAHGEEGWMDIRPVLRFSYDPKLSDRHDAGSSKILPFCVSSASFRPG